MNIRSALFITCLAVLIFGCVKPTRKLVKTVEEDMPQMAAETLPIGTFRIDRRSKDETPRVEITMLDGPAKGDQFTCNLITGPSSSFVLASECSGEAAPIGTSCVNREICFPVFECSCEAKDRGLPQIPLQNTPD